MELDTERYSYEELVFDLCIVSEENIGTLPPEWNHLERFEEGRTKLLHYTVGHLQPWRNTRNPLRSRWIKAYREALRERTLPEEEVKRGIRKGLLHPSLALDLSSISPAGRLFLTYAYFFQKGRGAAMRRLGQKNAAGRSMLTRGRILFFMDLIQDLDILLPLLKEALRRNAPFDVLVTDRLFRHSPRVLKRRAA